MYKTVTIQEMLPNRLVKEQLPNILFWFINYGGEEYSAQTSSLFFNFSLGMKGVGFQTMA